MRRALNEVRMVAPTDSAVLIQGETGTGKELIARAVHDQSPRRHEPFVTLNCAAIPSGLLESELFGHERGAYTGALNSAIGRFQLAHQGTLFLDEIGDMPLELQPKLLRVLQEQEFERLGSTRTIRVDVRIVAATNRDLSAMVQERRFRADLFYRLHVFPIALPPLRERQEDIPLLVRHFVEKFADRMNKQIRIIPEEVMEALKHYSWPGNIRELQNFIERAVILTSGPVLSAPLNDLKSDLKSSAGIAAPAGRAHWRTPSALISWKCCGKWIGWLAGIAAPLFAWDCRAPRCCIGCKNWASFPRRPGKIHVECENPDLSAGRQSYWWRHCYHRLLESNQSEQPLPRRMQVEVATVQQRDVPIYSEWIGTLDGFVNADIKAQVTGYLLEQAYRKVVRKEGPTAVSDRSASVSGGAGSGARPAGAIGRTVSAGASANWRRPRRRLRWRKRTSAARNWMWIATRRWRSSRPSRSRIWTTPRRTISPRRRRCSPRRRKWQRPGRRSSPPTPRFNRPRPPPKRRRSTWDSRGSPRPSTAFPASRSSKWVRW